MGRSFKFELLPRTRLGVECIDADQRVCWGPLNLEHRKAALAHQKIADRTTHIALVGCAESADLGMMSR